jgi:Ca2+-binding EF-hand superfamily protein
MFEHADKDNSGYLSYQEFAEAFKTLAYGLSDNDIKTLIALADDNADGKITWDEFIPVAIDCIKTFFARNKALQKMKDRERDIRREALQHVYAEENAKCTSIMTKRFKQIDEKNTGHIQIRLLREAMATCALLTPKEVNLIIRSIHPEQKTFEYKEFGQLLFEVRYELAKSRIMDTGLEKMADNMVLEFAAHDTKKDGTITITQAKKALFSSKHTTLTPM